LRHAWVYVYRNGRKVLRCDGCEEIATKPEREMPDEGCPGTWQARIRQQVEKQERS
jgi:hypothetical protein